MIRSKRTMQPAATATATTTPDHPTINDGVYYPEWARGDSDQKVRARKIIRDPEVFNKTGSARCRRCKHHQDSECICSPYFRNCARCTATNHSCPPPQPVRNHPPMLDSGAAAQQGIDHGTQVTATPSGGLPMNPDPTYQQEDHQDASKSPTQSPPAEWTTTSNHTSPRTVAVPTEELSMSQLQRFERRTWNGSKPSMATITIIDVYRQIIQSNRRTIRLLKKEIHQLRGRNMHVSEAGPSDSGDDWEELKDDDE